VNYIYMYMKINQEYFMELDRNSYNNPDNISPKQTVTVVILS